MVIYDEKNQILYIPSAGDKIIYDDYEEKIREAYQSGYTAGFEQGVADAEEACGPDYSMEYFTVEVHENSHMRVPSKVSHYRINGGPWVDNSEERLFDVFSGDTIEMKGNNDKCDWVFSSRAHSQIGVNVVMPGDFIVYGNIMSLLYGDSFYNKTVLPSANTFSYLFYETSGITDASNLVLPATSLTDACYSYFFYGCSKLTGAPKLNALNLAKSCYHSMFFNCASLTTAPELPATRLSSLCYLSMFENCINLETAPVLPTVETNYSEGGSSYQTMFARCEKLSYIKCLLKEPSDSYTQGWVDGVKQTGTFVKHPDAEWISGINGIPDGWTVVDAE